MWNIYLNPDMPNPQARGKMNVSEWGNYSAKKRDHALEEICNQILEGDMPDNKNTLLHRGARGSVNTYAWSIHSWGWSQDSTI